MSTGRQAGVGSEILVGLVHPRRLNESADSLLEGRLGRTGRWQPRFRLLVRPPPNDLLLHASAPAGPRRRLSGSNFKSNAERAIGGGFRKLQCPADTELSRRLAASKSLVVLCPWATNPKRRLRVCGSQVDGASFKLRFQDYRRLRSSRKARAAWAGTTAFPSARSRSIPMEGPSATPRTWDSSAGARSGR